jgi:deoxycytidine triphosphate deaminase
MPLLNRPEIEALLRQATPLIDGFDASVLSGATTPVRGSSLDLTIGQIFVPGTKGDELGGARQPREKFALKQGETAVIRTLEKLQVPADISGFGFPPSTDVSLAGLLTTNPGHIDPGYSGHLHLTVINMGSDTFVLKKGDRVMRLLFFKLSGPVPVIPPGLRPVVNDELLSRLSEDFLDVGNRAQEAADRAVSRSQLWVPVLALIASVAAALFTAWTQTSHLNDDVSARLSSMQTQITRMEGEVNASEGLAANRELSDRLAKMEDALKAMQASGKTLPK